jgi:hypothetical protein
MAFSFGPERAIIAGNSLGLRLSLSGREMGYSSLEAVRGAYQKKKLFDDTYIF